MKWLFWRERMEPAKTIIVGCSDAFFTVSLAWFASIYGGCLFLFLPFFLEFGIIITAACLFFAFLFLFAFFDRFQLEISADGFRLRYYFFGIVRRADTTMGKETRISVFDPDWDPEAERFAVGFFHVKPLRILAWLYYLRAGVAEDRLLEIAARYGLAAAKPVEQHEPI